MEISRGGKRGIVFCAVFSFFVEIEKGVEWRYQGGVKGVVLFPKGVQLSKRSYLGGVK